MRVVKIAILILGLFAMPVQASETQNSLAKKIVELAETKSECIGSTEVGCVLYPPLIAASSIEIADCMIKASTFALDRGNVVLSKMASFDLRLTSIEVFQNDSPSETTMKSFAFVFDEGYLPEVWMNFGHSSRTQKSRLYFFDLDQAAAEYHVLDLIKLLKEYKTQYCSLLD